MEKMTIHRALAELKLLDARILKAINSIETSGFMLKGKLVNNFYKEEDFKSDVLSKYQSIKDLMDRKKKIKSAIVKVNGVTTVKISEYYMTISDAITFKTLIEAKKEMINVLKRKHSQVKTTIEQNNINVNANALKLAEAAVGKDNVKIGDSDFNSVTKPYIENNTMMLVDPLGIEKLTETLEKEVDDFESEVDAVLSEINAITYIEI